MKFENLNILIKPTEYCNLDCQYCYAKPFREKYGKAKMTIEMFEKIISMAVDHAKNITIIWHGGEPTLMGVDWYYQCQEVLKKFDGTSFKQTLQTNGTMLDDSWAKLAKDTGIGFGSSFDVFDQEVRTSKMQTIEKQLKSFNKMGVEIGVITVINKANYTKQIEIYDYFKNNFRITPSFNTIFSSIGTRLNDLEMTPQEYAIEFDKFFDYILHDTSEKSSSERTVEQYFRNVIGDRHLICTYCDCTYQWIGFSSTGDVYPCDFLCEDYYMGNLKDVSSIAELYASEGHKRYREDRNKRMTNSCSKCKFLDYCNGGCNSMHISYSGNNQKVNPDYCNIMRKNFYVAYKHIKTIDMFNNTINPNLLKLLADTSIFTHKEIKEFLASKNIEFIDDQDINEYNVTDSIEFKIYRLFNPFKGKCIILDHSDYMEFREPYNEIKDLEGLKESRLINIEQRFEVEKDNILKLLNLEE